MLGLSCIVQTLSWQHVGSIFADEATNPGPLQRERASWPLDHQGSPEAFLLSAHLQRAPALLLPPLSLQHVPLLSVPGPCLLFLSSTWLTIIIVG